MKVESKVDAFKKAVDIIGGRKASADKLGVSTQAIGQWLSTGMPAGRAIEVSDLTKRKVTLDNLLR